MKSATVLFLLQHKAPHSRALKGYGAESSTGVNQGESRLDFVLVLSQVKSK